MPEPTIGVTVAHAIHFGDGGAAITRLVDKPGFALALMRKRGIPGSTADFAEPVPGSAIAITFESRASIDRLIWLLGEIKNDMAAEEPF
jgi:hypothetical protein